LKLGWRFMVIWECELRGAADLENKIKSFLEGDE
jgi:G:T-mismatch repair DNA endonuclease (very short patch repair protein)